MPKIAKFRRGVLSDAGPQSVGGGGVGGGLFFPRPNGSGLIQSRITQAGIPPNPSDTLVGGGGWGLALVFCLFRLYHYIVSHPVRTTAALFFSVLYSR